MKLSVAYGTSTENGTKTAAQTWGTYAAMKAARPKLCAYLESKGVSNAEALKSYRLECDVIECMKTDPRAWIEGQDIIGVFLTTMPFEVEFQKFSFGGSAAYTGTGYNTGGTCFKIDHANWKVQWKTARHIFNVNGWGQPTNVGGAYGEGFIIENVMLDGGRSHMPYDNTFESYGICVRQSGSAGIVGGKPDANGSISIVANGFNTAGFGFAGGIPICLMNTRSFYNGRFGYHFVGTALSTGEMHGLETDDCGEDMYRIEPGFGQEGGGNLTFYSSKLEVGKNGTEPMRIATIRGRAGEIQFFGVHAALYNGCTVPTAFDVQGSGSNMKVTVCGFNECGSSGSFTKLLTTASKSYGMTNTGGNSCKPISFVTDGTTMKACTSALSGTTQPDTITNILPVLVGDEDDTPCPDCPDCPPIPPPPTEIKGPWYKSGYCRNGNQTWKRQVVYFIGNAGKVRYETDVQPCSVTVHP